MEKESSEEEGILKAAGAELLSEGRTGVRIHGWEIESSNRPILTSLNYEQWGEKLKTSHLPEMVFGESCLVLKHLSSGIKIHFNAFDALTGWKKEGLPPVEVPAAAQWKFRRWNRSKQDLLYAPVRKDNEYNFSDGALYPLD